MESLSLGTPESGHALQSPLFTFIRNDRGTYRTRGGVSYIFLIVILPRLEEMGRAGTSIRATSRSGLNEDPEFRLDDAGEGFSGILRSAMVESLENILGKPALGALVVHYKIDKMAEDPRQMHETLGGVFGNGATVLEKVILKELYKRLGLVLGDTAFSFSFDRLVSEARDALKRSRRVVSR